jgi:hypothetical protein
MLNRILVIAAVTMGTILTANAEKLSGPLEGTYGFFGDACDEQGKGKDCKLTIEIKGAAAKALFERIRWKAKPDECTEGVVKDTRTGLRCYKVGAEYSCDFGISFLQNSMTNSDVTC